MSRNPDPPIPSRLRDRLQAQDAEEQADLEAVWHLLGTANAEPDDTPDLDDAWAALQRRRPEIEPDPAPSSSLPQNGQGPPASASVAPSDRGAVRPRRAQRWGRWVGALAVVVLMAVGAAWIWRQPVTVTAAPGQQRTATLPDGSTVNLNSGSSLTYRRGFRAWPFVDAPQRRVRLDGEGFFSAASGSRPFVVATATARIEVTGTRFNVRARTAVDSTTAVTIAEGRVEVRSRRHPDRPVVLDERGETSQVQPSQAAPSAPTIRALDPVLAWRQDGFAVTETPLSTVVHELEQRHDTVIRLHPSVQRTNAPITLYYPTSTSLSTILRDLCTALNLNYRPTSQGYELFAGPSGR